MAEFLYFNSRDELLRISSSSVVYLQAEGNYSVFVLENGYKAVVGANLGSIEKVLVASLGEKSGKFARIGKSHIVNLSRVLCINPMKQELILSDQKTFTYTLNISKDALRKLKDLMISRKTVRQNQ